MPSTQLLLLLVGGLICLFAGWYAWAKRFLAALILLWLIYASPFPANYLTDRLENTYPVMKGEQFEAFKSDVQDSEAQVYIVVLGAGSTTDPRFDYTQMVATNTMLRLVEGVRLYRKLPESTLVTSAGYFGDTMSQAEVVRRAAILLGVDENEIQIQDQPRNTCEEARAFAQNREPGTVVLISTAAHHQRRAVMLFEKQGMSPVAAPASFLNKHSASEHRQRLDWKPSLKNVRTLERMLKEYIGYWWGKRSC